MRLIRPSFEIWEQPSGLEGIYKQIEKCAKICYKSEGNITEDSAKPFIDNVLLKRHHHSPLEHSTVYLKVPNEGLLRNFTDNTPSHFNYGWCRTNPIMDEDNNVYITTNYRHIIEHKLEDYLKYLCELTEFHEKRITVKFILSRSIAQEYTRHRVFSFSMESQRYCNYSTDKFNNEVTFIIPCWADSLALQKACNKTIANADEFGEFFNEYYYYLTGKEESWFRPWEITSEQNFVTALQVSEKLYLELLNQGWKPQQAREVLPNACKTELVMTGFVSDWKHFFSLRCDKAAHPSAQELAIPLREEFIKRGYINE